MPKQGRLFHATPTRPHDDVMKVSNPAHPKARMNLHVRTRRALVRVCVCVIVCMWVTPAERRKGGAEERERLNRIRGKKTRAKGRPWELYALSNRLAALRTVPFTCLYDQPRHLNNGIASCTHQGNPALRVGAGLGAAVARSREGWNSVCLKLMNIHTAYPIIASPTSASKRLIKRSRNLRHQVNNRWVSRGVPHTSQSCTSIGCRHCCSYTCVRTQTLTFLILTLPQVVGCSRSLEIKACKVAESCKLSSSLIRPSSISTGQSCSGEAPATCCCRSPRVPWDSQVTVQRTDIHTVRKAHLSRATQKPVNCLSR